MNTYPLIRVRWSNEHIMAALFGVLLLYLLPGFIEKPRELAEFVPVLLLALAIDAAAGIVRYKRPVCSVSAAVTAAILQLLTPGVPLWGRLAGVAAALLFGKHIWGGTGRNPLNPALTGMLLLSFLFRPEAAFTGPLLLYLPAMLLSLPFILFRPFTGVGLIAGMNLAALLGGYEAIGILTVACVFFGCLVITDPVTITDKRVPGFIGGLLAGLVPVIFGGTILYTALGILIFNLVSQLLDARMKKPGTGAAWNFIKIRNSAAAEAAKNDEMVDLSGKRVEELENFRIPEAAEILERIEMHRVFGMGGAGFTTAEKLKAAMESEASKKYLIINAVECDPGLIHDKWLLRNRFTEISRGIEALCACNGFSRVVLAAKNISGIESSGNIELFKAPDMYPAGAEKILIEKVLGNRLAEGAIPAKEGILTLNVQTALAVYDAVFNDEDADTRYLTIADLKNGKNRVARVRLGDRIRDVLDKAYSGANLAFAGGGIMQARMVEDEDVIDNMVNYIASSVMPKYKESPQCSHCGLCRRCCPAGLDAGRIAELVDSGMIAETSALAPGKCIGCGSCSYVCLAGRNLSARVKKAKYSLYR